MNQQIIKEFFTVILESQECVKKHTTRQDIEEFEKSFAKLNIAYTPKIHVLIDHVADFCEEYGCLGPFSTQSGESCHSDFRNTMKNYFVHELTNNELYAKKLLAAVNKYNAKHLQNSVKRR